MNYVTVTPAYGRDYKSAKDALTDWNSGKDFVLQPQGVYCSCRDFGPENTINIRYKRMTLVTVVKGK